MSTWGYCIYNSENRLFKKNGGNIPTEQEARKKAVDEMKGFSEEPGPFLLELIVYSETCRPMGMGKERYSQKEIEEYGTGEVLSFGELMSIAKDRYNEGGDGIYECWNQKTFDNIVRDFGPIKRNMVDLFIHRY